MQIKELDKSLLELAWSLWTELGVAGTLRRHQNHLILIEELVLLTSILGEIDPRLRDESLDWCSQYYHFISVSRLKALLNEFDNLKQSFSLYSATLNEIAPKAGWPTFSDIKPLKIQLSRKSVLMPLESPALLSIRSRSIFCTGARADLITYFIMHSESDFAVSDLVEVGYSKRNLAEILEDLNLGGFIDKFQVRNLFRYRLKKTELVKILGPLPNHAPSWKLLFKVLLTLRDCIKRTEKSSESTQVVEIRNKIIDLDKELRALEIIPPVFQMNFGEFLLSFKEWLLKLANKVSMGK